MTKKFQVPSIISDGRALLSASALLVDSDFTCIVSDEMVVNTCLE